MPKFESLPDCMQTQQLRRYYDILLKKRPSLVLKRISDVILSLVLIVILLLPMAIIAVVVKATSRGKVIFRQTRVTKYGRNFKILKFRTMTVAQNSDASRITLKNDSRITRCGAFLRKYRLDELPQLFNVLAGQMSFVGTRPEVPEYVARYTPEMYATLLMPAGITSLASLKFKDESELLSSGNNTDDDYVNVILPQKMELNLKYIEDFSIPCDIKIMLKTVVGVAFD